jgi:hypothetical protein
MEESTNIDAYLEERKKDAKASPVEVEPFVIFVSVTLNYSIYDTSGSPSWWP